MCWSSFGWSQVISSISPKSGPVGTTVTIYGSDFAGNKDRTSVTIGGKLAQVVSTNSSQVVFTVPQGCSSVEEISLHFSFFGVWYTAKWGANALPWFTVTSSPNSPFNYTEHVTAVEMNSDAFVTGDFNNDGITDIVEFSWESDKLHIFFGNGDGDFTYRDSYPAGAFVSAIKAVDLNADGWLEIVTVNLYDKNIRVYEGKGNGYFTLPKKYYLPQYMTDVNFADFNSDGLLDLLTVNKSSGDVTIFLKEPYGDFYYASSYEVGDEPWSSAIGDFNRDGNPDVAVVNNMSNSVSFLYGDGAGHLGNRRDYTVGTGPGYIAAGDFDGDGIIDLAVSIIDLNYIQILTGNGNGTFVVGPLDNTTCAGPNQVIIGDYDGDGITDLIFSSRATPQIGIMRGWGNNAFRPAKYIDTQNIQMFVDACDLNNDGRTDLITVTGEISRIRAFINSPITPPVAIVPTNIGTNSLTVNWEAVPNATNYYVDITSDPNFVNFDTYNNPPNQELPGTQTSKNIIGLSPTTRYYYRIRALTSNGMTGNGNVVTCRTKSPFVITSFSPTSGPVGTTVTINGTNFSTTPADNIVYFGQVKATVTAATATTLTITVPPGAGSIVPVSVVKGTVIAFSDASSTQFFTITNSPATSGYFEKYYIHLIKPEANFIDNDGNYFTSKASAGFGDFNGDGNVDMIVTEHTPHVAVYYSGNGKGRFEKMKSFPIEHVPSYTPVTGDFNGDGNLDFAITNSNYVCVYLGDGTGDFTLKGNYSTGSKPMKIVVSDLNGDGVADIVAANFGSANVSILYGVGDGSFEAPVNLQSGAKPTCLAVNDMNNDGSPDIIVNSIDEGNIITFLNDGLGEFGEPLTTFVNERPYKFTILDINKDGILDLVATGCYNNTLISCFGSGDGYFIYSKLILNARPEYISSADLNGDSHADVIVTYGNKSTNATIIYGGPVLAVKNVAVGWDSPREITIADFNKDGKADFAVMNDNQLFFYYNSNSPTLSEAFDITESSFKINLSSDAPVTNYYLDVATDADFTNMVNNGGAGNENFGSNTTVTVTGLPTGTNLYYRAKGEYSGQMSVYTSTYQLKTKSVFKITSISPVAGLVGSTVTISGLEFDAIPANNSVYFGPVKATVTSASYTTLTVTVPAGAGSYIPVSVSKGGLVATSSLPAASFFTITNPLPLGYKYSLKQTSLPYDNYRSIVTGDFNNDGKADVAMTEWYTDMVRIVYGIGDGTFGNETLIPVAHRPTSIVMADFIGDGKLDLAVISQESGLIYVLTNNGDGTFTRTTDIGTGYNPVDMEVGDFNNDRQMDIAIIDPANDKLVICLNNGNGAFYVASEKIILNGRNILAGKFNADLNTDIIASQFRFNNFCDPGILPAYGEGNGNFTLMSFIELGNPHSLSAGDFDKDGKLDIAFIAWYGTAAYIYLGKPNLTFTALNLYGVGGAKQLEFGDYNGDGTLELGYISDSKGFSIMNINEFGTLVSQTNLSVAGYPIAFASGDFNNDGRADILTIHPDQIDVLLNKPPDPPVATAAINISGTAFTAKWNSAPNATGYAIDVSTDENFTTFVNNGGAGNENTGNTLAKSFTGLTGATTYYYRVRSTSSNGMSNNSNVISVSTLIIPPTAVAASGITKTSFTANWTSLNAPSSFYLDVATDENFTAFVNNGGVGNEDVGNVLSKTVSGLTIGTTYHFRVRAHNTTGTSLNSNVISCTTGKDDQTITFNDFTTPLIYGLTSTPFNLTASASSGLPITFTSDNTSVITVLGNAVTTVGTGTAHIIASQAGNYQYLVAPNVSKTIEILPNPDAPGYALSFNGTDNYVTVPYNFTGYTKYSVEGWIKPTNTTTNAVISSHNSFNINIINGKFTHLAWDGAIIEVAGTTTVETGKWYHVAVTAENGGMARLYVNGIEEGTPAAVGTLWNGGVNGYELGRSGSAYFSGSMDEIRVWNEVRTSSEIQNNAFYVIDPATTGLTNYYKFDQLSGNSLHDYTTPTEEGTINGTATWVESYAMIMPKPLPATDIQSTSFTANWSANIIGEVNRYLLDVSTTSNFSSFVYQNVDCGTAVSKSVTSLTPGLTYYYRVRSDKTSVTGQGGIYPASVSATTIKASQTISFGTINSPLIYSVSATQQYFTVSASSDLTVGLSSDNTSVAIIAGSSIILQGPGIVHITASQAGNSNYFAAPDVVKTVVVLPNLTAPGNALSFNGTSDFVDLPFSFSGNTAYTIEAWVKPETTDNQVIISANDGSGYTSYFELSIVNGKFQHTILSGIPVSISGTSTIVAGHWYHVALTAQNGGMAKLYVNGIEEGTAQPVSSLWTTGNRFYFGKSGQNAGYFKGSLDEVRVWSSAKADSFIQANMYNEVSTSSSGLVVYYRFNQTENNTLYNLVSNSNHGSISNATWVESYAMVVPKAFAAGSIQNTSFTANWTAPTVGAVTQYLLDVSTSYDFSSFVTDYNGVNCGTNLSHTISGLSPATTYFSRVRADKSSVTNQGGYSVDIISVTTTKIDQTINFEPISSPVMVSETPISLTASASSGLDVNLSSDNPSIANFVNGELKAVGGGTVTITAKQSGNQIYNVATNVSRTFTVNMNPPGNALYFDGKDDNVSIANTNLFRYPVFTVESWAKVMGGSDSYRTVFSHRGSGQTGFAVYAANDNTWKVMIGNGSWTTVSSNIQAVVNKWTHIAVTYNGFVLNFYIDGNLAGTVTCDYTPNSTYPILIGAGENENQPNYAQFFDGEIDEVRYWYAFRTQAEIRQTMYSPLTGAENNLVAYHTFDFGSPFGDNRGFSQVPDKTTFHNPGTLNNFALTESFSNFTESYAMVVPVPSAATNVLPASFTANWTAPVIGTVTKYLLDVSKTSDFSTFFTGYWRFDCGANLSQAVTGLEKGTTYYYRVCAYKSSIDSDGPLYFNPVQVTTISDQTIAFQQLTSPVNVGVSPITLSATATSGLPVAYTSDNNSVATLLGNTLTVVGGGTVTITASQAGNAAFSAAANITQTLTINMVPPGNALHFDGSNDYVTIPHTEIYNSISGVTIEIWIYRDDVSSGTICGKGTEQFEISILANNVVRFIPVTGVYLDSPANSLMPNRWNHVACVYSSGNSIAKIYINGVDVGAVNNGSQPVTTALTIPVSSLKIGSRSDGTNLFKGKIDEFRIWSTVKTLTEIKNNMFSFSGEGLPGLLGYYNFNSGIDGGNNTSLTAITDQSTYQNNGTLQNFALTGTTSNFVESYAMVMPVADAASSIQSTGFTANWTAPEIGSITNYLLDVSTTSDFSSFVTSYNAADCGTNLSKSVTGLVGGTTYYYRVRADKTSVTGQGGYFGAPISVTTLKADQTITFPAISSPIFVGASPFSLTATASSDLTVTYESDNNSVATVSGNAVTVVGAGTVSITASQAGNTTYNAAPNVVRSFEVLPAMTAPGNALNFNGSTNFVDFPYSFSGYTAYTIEAWIKPVATTNQVILSGNDGSGSTFSHEIRINNGKFQHYTYDSNTGLPVIVTGTSIVQAGTWYHVAITATIGQQAHLFVNGIEEGTAASINQPWGGGNRFYLGKSGNNTGYFSGSLDEVRFWNSARTGEVLRNNMYNVVASTTSGLVAYFRCDQTSGNTLYDITLNGHNGTISTPDWVESYAMVVPVPQEASNIITTSFTANWTEPSVGTVTKYLLDVSYASDFSSFVGSYHNYNCGTNLSQSVTGLSTGNTYYYRVRADKTSVTDQGGFYRTPISVTTGKSSQTITFSPISTPVVYGETVTIDLSATATSGLTVTFTSDNPSIASINGNTLTIAGGGVAHITADQTGNANYYAAPDVTQTLVINMNPPGNTLNFDGTNDYVELPNESQFDFTTSMTVECWLKVNAFDKNWQAIITKGDNSWRIHRSNNTNKISFATGATDDLQSTTAIVTGKWYHVAAVYDGSTKKIYINGILEGISGLSGSLPNNDYAVAIGENLQSTGRYFNGNIDEVRIWNVARSEEQIKAAMFSPVATNATGLVSYYNFDIGNPSTPNLSLTKLYDQTTNANDGTLKNFTLNGSTSNCIESYAMVVPVSQAATDILNTSFKANWNAPAIGTVTKYLLDVSTSSDFSTLVDGYNSKDCGTNLYQTVSGLTAKNTYYYRVRADKTSITGEGAFSGSISVATVKSNQTITFDPVNSPVTLGVSPISLSAVASSGLQVSFESDNTSVATVSGNSLTILSSGIVNIIAHQTGNENFNSAPEVTQRLIVGMTAPGNALNFDPANSNSVNCGSVLASASAFTIEAWIKPEENSGPNTIVASKLSGCGTGGFAMYINSFSTQNHALVVETNGCGTLYTLANSVKMGVWQHVALVVNNSGSAKLFIDGIEQTTLGSYSTTTLSAPLTLGDFSSGTTSHFYYKGAIDEVRIWNSAMSATQIQTNLYNTVNPANSGLLAYYRFDQNSGSTLYDLSSNSNNGSIVNPSWIESYAMVVPTPSAASNIQPTSFIANWAAPAVGSVTKYLLDVSTTSDFSSFVTDYEAADCGTNLSKSVTGLTAATTYYYRVRANKTEVTGQGGFYRNSISTNTLKQSQAINFSTVTSPVIIGVSPISLTASATSGLDVSFETDNHLLATVSGNTLTVLGVGTVHITASQAGNATYAAAPDVIQTLEILPPMTAPGNALHFDPTNTNIVNCGTVLNSATAFTIEAWIKPEANSGTITIASKKTFVCASAGFAFQVYNAINEDYRLQVQSNDCATLSSESNAIKIGKWQHIALVVSNSTSAKLFINGIEQTTYGSFQISSLSDNLILGDYLLGSMAHDYFKGNMDEVRIWNSALSAVQIQSNMYNTINPATSGLISYYKFDQTSGSTLYDATSNDNHGTIINPSWTESYAMVVPVPQAAGELNKTSFTANWNAPAVGTVTKYLLDISTNSNFSSFITNYNGADCGTELSKSVTGLIGGTTYYYRVRAEKTSVSGEGGYYRNSQSVTTLKDNQTITFAPFVAPIIFDMNPIELTATASSGLGVSYAGDNNSVATFFENLMYLQGSGSVNFTASQAGNANYNAASNVVRNLVVLPKMTTPGNALNYNGTNAYTTVPYNFTGYTAYTIEGWFRPTSTENQVIVAGNSGNGLTESHALKIYNGKFEHYTYDGGTKSVAGTTNIKAGIWYHVAITASNGGQARLFVNGVEEGTAVSIGTLWTGGNQFYIGKSGYNTPFYNGSTDEVRFWNSVRTGTEIQTAMYDVIDPSTSGLISYYRFDQNEGSTLYDLTSNANNGAIQNATWVESYAMVVPVLQAATSVTTTSFRTNWSLPNVGSFATVLLDISTASDFSTFVTGYNGADCGISMTKLVTGLSGGTTYYYRVRTDKTSVTGQGGYYRNGNSVSTTKLDQTITFSPIASPVIMGVSPITLTSSASSDLTVAFESDNTSVATVLGNTLTVVGAGTVNITAKQAGNSTYNSAADVIRILEVLPNMATPGNALSFNGTSSYTSVPYSFSEYSAYTIEAWIKPSSTSNQVIISGNDGSGDTHSHGIEIYDGKFRHFTYDTVNGVASILGTTNVQAGVWYHVAITVTNGDKAKLFVNGVEEGTEVSVVSLWTNGNRFYLGKSGSNTDYFTGALDEVRFWNFARDVSDISAKMFDVISPSTTGLISYYKFDQTSGSTLYDATSHANHGTIQNSVWVESYAMVVPVAIAATDVTSTGFTARWTAPSKGNSPTNYYIDVATDAAFTSMVTGWENKSVGSAATSIAVNTNFSVYYRLRADNGHGQSIYSGTIQVVNIPPAAPLAAAATNITSAGFTANWNTSNTATAYYLDVATDAGFSNKVIDNQNVMNVTTFDVGSLSVATQYFYRVRANNTIGTSENSNAISLTTSLVLNPSSNVLYVSTLGAGLKDGSSWANALDGANFINNISKLNFAISQVTSGTQVWVAAGTYKPTNGIDRSISFNLKEGVKVYGSFAGKETAIAQRNMNRTISILSGDIGTISDKSDNSYHVVYNDDIDPSIPLTSATILDGFTIQGGNANGDYDIIDYKDGGGMMLQNCSPDISNCKIIDNTAKSYGGGVSIWVSHSRFTNCVFSGNSAYTAGGIENWSGNPTFVNCIISGNYASSDASGISNTGDGSSSPQFINCTISGNKTDGSAGAISNQLDFGDMTIPVINCIIWNNANGSGTGTAISNVCNGDGSITMNYSNSMVQNITTADGNNNLNGVDNANNSNYPLFIAPIDLSTATLPTTSGDFRLQKSSVCINAGTNSANTTTTNLGGSPRVMNSTIDMGAYENQTQTFTWTGTSGTDWDNPANWDLGSVPTDIDVVTVPNVTNKPVANALSVAAGGTVTINASSAVDATNLANNGTIIIKSDAFGTGSLITSVNASGSGQALVERYMSMNKWHIISSPTGTQTISNFLADNIDIPIVSGTDPVKYGMMDYNTTTNNWNPYFTSATTGTLGIGKGYMVRVIDPVQNLRFQGIINAPTTTTVSTGWNCIGNPFTSAIRIIALGVGNNFIGANAGVFDLSYGGLYFWNELATKYDVVTLGDATAYNASVGQGFFMKAKPGATSVTFTPAMQVHNTDAPFKATTAPIPQIKLMVASGNKTASTDIKFVEGTTKGLDFGYDAGLFTTDKSFALYTKLVEDNGVDFQLQCLPTNQYKELVISIGLDSKTGGEIVFSVQTVQIDPSCKAILEDKLTNTFTDLSTGSYETSVAANTAGTGRFFLHTADIVSGVEDQVLPGKLTAFAVRNVEIRVIGEVGEGAVATLVNGLGKVVLTKKLGAGNLNIIGLPNLSSGVYLLNIDNNGRSQTIKVMVRK